jgi:cbb3-type cytochrome oxidase subunit 3
MTLLLLEALAALVLLIFIVWWTMFSGRKKGELPEERRAAPSDNDRED